MEPDSFAYASAFDEDANRYVSLVGGQHAAVVLDASAVIVKPNVAAPQIDERARPAAAGGEVEDGGTTTAPTTGPTQIEGTTGTSTTQEPGVPKRFYGRISLEPVRMLRDLGDIANAIVAQLGRADAAVAISVEIEAMSDVGFPDDVRRTVSENARTLKFETHEFEE